MTFVGECINGTNESVYNLLLNNVSIHVFSK